MLLAALVAPSMGQTAIDFDVCKRTTDFRDKDTGGDGNFDSNREGSQRRTYGNLCSGSRPFTDTNTGNSKDIDSRIGDPFRRLCDLIDRYPNVLALMQTGQSPHTIFAPTDAAFAKIDGLLGRLDEQNLLELHILPQARLTRDLRCGQTYRTINTQQDRRNRQRSKSRCISAFRTQQLGPGNVRNGLKPTIGVPTNIFNAKEFENQNFFTLSFNPSNNDNSKDTFSQDVISCNGVIHVVDEILLPGNNRFGSGYYGSKSNGGYYGSKGYSNGVYNGYYSGTSGGTGYYSGPGKGFAGKNGKGGKGNKGAKSYGYRRNAPYYQNSYNNYYGGSYYGRALEVEGEEEPDEMFMSDAEFFGTTDLVEEEMDNKQTETRKRRLEALLEPDGNVVEV